MKILHIKFQWAGRKDSCMLLYLFFFQFIDATDGYSRSVLCKELSVLMEMFWSRAS